MPLSSRLANALKIAIASEALGQELVDVLNAGIDPPSGISPQSVGTVALGTSYLAVTGASITLPSAGKYKMFYHIHGNVNDNTKLLNARLFNVTAGAEITDSLAIVLFVNIGSATSLQATASMTAFITITVPTIIRLEAKANSATGCSSLNDVNGSTVIGFHAL